jgi:hypothetical protein
MKRALAVLAAAVAGLLVYLVVAPSTTPTYADTTGLDDVVLSHSFKGTTDIYNYSPTVVQSGTTRHYFWCGYDEAYSGFDSDTILTQSYDTATHEKSAVSVVLRPTQGAWDKEYTCNPSVVMGHFTNPTDGKSYDIALYYVGASNGSGVHNSIGVAYSNDWHTFVKRSTPVLSPPSDCVNSDGSAKYGYGQPTAYNHDGNSQIWLFYDDTCVSRYKRVIIDDNTRGQVDTITANGFPHGTPGLEFAYDSSAHVWYAVGGYDSDRRKVDWTNSKGHAEHYEHGAYTFQLYKIAEGGLVTGDSAWSEVTRVDTNLTGYESSTIPTIVRNTYGNVNIGDEYPNIVMPFGVSNIHRPPAKSTLAADAVTTDKQYWKISEITYRPGNPLRPFKRYFSAGLHRNEVTTGYVDTSTFAYERTLGSLYEEPTGDATRALYGCRNDPDDYFVSTSSTCEGKKVLGLEGYAFPTSGTGHDIPLYRCNTGTFHLVSTDPNCEGWTKESLLGYAYGSNS